MKRSLFNELLASMHAVLDHARGKVELRSIVLPSAPAPMTAREVLALRERLNMSQAVFALYLNVSTRLVQAWEANRRRPEGAALRLLELGLKAPEVVFEGLTRRKPPKRRRRGAFAGT